MEQKLILLLVTLATIITLCISAPPIICDIYSYNQDGCVGEGQIQGNVTFTSGNCGVIYFQGDNQAIYARYINSTTLFVKGLCNVSFKCPPDSRHCGYVGEGNLGECLAMGGSGAWSDIGIICNSVEDKQESKYIS